MATSIVMVVNPAAGGGRAMRALPGVQASLRAIGASFVTKISDDPAAPHDLAARAVEAGASVVLAIGGDGLVGQLAGALVNTPTALAVIPTGTGNDFARAVGFPRKPGDMRWILEAPVRAIDAGLIATEGGERTFVNVAGAGFDAVVNERANTLPGAIEGTPRYLLAASSTLRKFAPIPFRLSVDGVALERAAMLIAVANSTTYGGGMRVAPDAQLDDGLLDICIVHAMSRRAFVANFPRVFRGTHVTDSRITMLRGAAVEIDAPDAQVYADGEHVGLLPASISVQPRALRLVDLRS